MLLTVLNYSYGQKPSSTIECGEGDDMNMVQFGKLLGMIESLSDSTAVVYEHRGLLAGLDGRCSSFLSHRIVNFAVSESTMPEGIRNMLRIAGNREILIGTRPLDEKELEDLRFWWPGHQVVQEQVPVHLLKKVLEEAERLVNFGSFRPSVGYRGRQYRGETSTLATVVFPVAIVAHWGDDGKPSFVDPDEAMADLLGLPTYDLDSGVKILGLFIGAQTKREALRALASIRYLRVAEELSDIRWVFGVPSSPEENPVEDMSQFAHYVDSRTGELHLAEGNPTE